jgi:hypothetical protein
MKPTRHIALLLAVASLSGVAHPAFAQIAGAAGAFSRMGFGARGIGMGNALTAVATGDLVSYYNPALVPLTPYRHASATLGVLSLDRSLNFLHYSQALPPNAGVSVGIINAGVSDIDGRDSDGRPTGMLTTSENAAFLGFGIKFKPGFSLGLNIKMNYYQLYTDVSSFTAGLDLGAAYPLNESLTVGATARDVISKYKWDTGELFGQNGQQTEVPFPKLYTFGASYRLPDSLGILAADIEFSDQSTATLRVGAEFDPVPEFSLRAGLDRIDLKEKGTGVRPTAGFTLRKGLGSWIPALTYAFVMEPFVTTGTHFISLGAAF